MHRNYLKRFDLIISFIRSRGKCSYQEIRDYLLNHPYVDQIISNESYSIRTLQRDIKAINQMNDFTIKSIRKHGVYFINEQED